MILGLKLLVALAVLVLPGEALMRLLAPGSRWGWYRPLVAFGIGQGAAMWCLWLLGMAGVPMWSWGVGIVMAGSVLGLWFLWRDVALPMFSTIPSSPSTICVHPVHLRFSLFKRFCPLFSGGSGWKSRGKAALACVPWMILFLAAWVVAVHAAEEALEFRIGDVAGMGNWAYKAKLLLLSGGWPADFFGYEAHNRRMGYPPGFPLLCGWCAVFMGGLETHAIRLLSVLLTAGAFLLAGGEMICFRRWWGLPGVGGLLALFLGYPGRGILSHFYAEPLLLYLTAVAVLALARAGRGGGEMTVCLLATGAMAWVKNEGAVAFLLLAGASFVFAGRGGVPRKRILIAAMCMGMVFIVPWRLYLAAHGWHDESFAAGKFFGEGRWGRLAGAWVVFRDAMLRDGSRLGGAWWLLPVLGWCAWWAKDCVALPALVLAACGLVAVAILMMMGSAEEDFEWHLAAAPRVLLCPSLMLLMGYAYIGMNSENRKT